MHFRISEKKAVFLLCVQNYKVCQDPKVCKGSQSGCRSPIFFSRYFQCACNASTGTPKVCARSPSCAQDPNLVQDPQGVCAGPPRCVLDPKVCAGPQYGARSLRCVCRIPKVCAGFPKCVHDPQGVFRIPKGCARTPRCEQIPKISKVCAESPWVCKRYPSCMQDPLIRRILRCVHDPQGVCNNPPVFVNYPQGLFRIH
jgi:hypothetical protein